MAFFHSETRGDYLYKQFRELRSCGGGTESKTCEPFPPYSLQKRPKRPNLSKICPCDCFGGFQSGGLKFGKICQNLSENYRFSNFDKFFQISVPLTGTPQNNRWDKFWTNLGFQAFLKAVGGKSVRNPKPPETRKKKIGNTMAHEIIT